MVSDPAADIWWTGVAAGREHWSRSIWASAPLS